jgi:hypothetical protein
VTPAVSPVADAVGSRVRVPAGTDVDGALLAEELPGEVVAVTEGARWVRVDGGGSPVLVALAC